MNEREQAEPRRARERPDLIEPARLRERGEHAAIGFVARRGSGASSVRSDEPHAGELAHQRVGERAVELLLEVRARPRRERELMLRARRIRGDAALEHERRRRSSATSRASRATSARFASSPSATITRAAPQHEHLVARASRPA